MRSFFIIGDKRQQLLSDKFELYLQNLSQENRLIQIDHSILFKLNIQEFFLKNLLKINFIFGLFHSFHYFFKLLVYNMRLFRISYIHNEFNQI